jgi:hypothetical protein
MGPSGRKYHVLPFLSKEGRQEATGISRICLGHSPDLRTGETSSLPGWEIPRPPTSPRRLILPAATNGAANALREPAQRGTLRTLGLAVLVRPVKGENVKSAICANERLAAQLSVFVPALPNNAVALTVGAVAWRLQESRIDLHVANIGDSRTASMS